jgi:hypothetical protein
MYYVAHFNLHNQITVYPIPLLPSASLNMLQSTRLDMRRSRYEKMGICF